MSDIDLSIRLPRDVYLALIPKADRNGIQVHHLIEGVIVASVRGPKPKGGKGKSGPKLTRAESEKRDREVKKLHRKGWSDNRIGASVGCTGRHVGDIRRRLGLPANYRKFGSES